MTTNGLLEIFRKLVTAFQGEFLITPAVKYETIEHPINIKRFEWGAIRIGHLLDDEVIKMASDEEDISEKELSNKTQEIMNNANNALTSAGKPIHLIERGESECLALSIMLTKNNIDNVVVIDERTARMLCESPDNLKELMGNKLESKIKVNYENLKELSKIKIIRSTELMYLANKHRLLDGDKKALEAVLYALKFGGCSISEKEVELMKKG